MGFVKAALVCTVAITTCCIAHQAWATMPTLTDSPSPPLFQSCKVWAASQSDDAFAEWGIQESGGNSKELAISRLINTCMGEKPPEIVGFGSSVGYEQNYCSRHQDQQICKGVNLDSMASPTAPDYIVKKPILLVAELKKSAEGGDAEAMRNLGTAYHTGGFGLPIDKAESLYWMRKAAGANDPTAMNNIGAFYEEGDAGLAKDEVAARHWYELAAGLGNGLAMKNLAAMYEDGRGGLKQSYEAAFAWYKRGAEAGNARAMLRLGLLYRSGSGTTQDSSKAFFWAQKAAQADDAWAMDIIGSMMMTGEGTPKNEASGFSWFRKGAEAGDNEAMTDLSQCYGAGVGTTKNPQIALLWLRKGAESGSPRAMYWWAAGLEQGSGNLQEALEWYKKSAEAGSNNAQASVDRLTAILAEMHGNEPNSDRQEAAETLCAGHSDEAICKTKNSPPDIAQQPKLSPAGAAMAALYPWAVKSQTELTSQECARATRHDLNFWWSKGQCHMHYIRYASGVAVRDTHAVEDPASLRRKGDLFSPTGWDSESDTYCEHGGYCYPAKDIKLLGTFRDTNGVLISSCELLEKDAAAISAAGAQKLLVDCR